MMTNETINIFALSKQDTSVLKGIAIIAMLCHHVYNWHLHEIPYSHFLIALGVLGKICVAIFLFCSGYGLAVQYEKAMTISSHIKDKLHTTIIFVIKRLIKFYSAYWFVFLIFVPITIFCFHRPLSAAYGGNVNTYWYLLRDMFCLNGGNAFNATWWFNTLIVLLYIVFPCCYFFIRKLGVIGLLCCFILMRYSSYLGVLNIYSVPFWQYPFVIGVFLSVYRSNMEQFSIIVQRNVWLLRLALVIIAGFFIMQKLSSDVPNIVPLGVVRADDFSALLIIFLMIYCCTFKIISLQILTKILDILGTHSINIYFIHTFLNVYWKPIKSIIHTDMFCKCGGDMLLLLFLSLCLSILIEFSKEKIGWSKITSLIIQKIEKNETKSFQYQINE